MCDKCDEIKTEVLKVLESVTPMILAMGPFFKEEEDGWRFQGEPRDFEKAVVEIHDQFREIGFGRFESTAMFLLHTNAAICFRIASAIAYEHDMSDVEDILDHAVTLLESVSHPDRSESPEPSEFIEEVTKMIAAGVPVDEAMKRLGEKAGVEVHKIDVDALSKPTLH